MKGVSFDSIHTSKFGIYLSKITLGTPKIKEYKIDIPGADGSLDLTDYFGSTNFDDRKITLTFTFPQRGSELLAVYSEFMTAFHGKYIQRIIFDEDPDYHYTGRISVGDLSKSTLSKVSVECKCKPFKYSNTVSTIVMNVSDIEYPDWLYGDINGDGVINDSDKRALTSLVGKRTFESQVALRGDFDFDGTVGLDELDAMVKFLNAGGGDFKLYVKYNTSLILRNCKRQTIDFGSSPTEVHFDVENIDRTRLWDLRIDNISQFDLGSKKSYSVFLSGIHEVMITTANTNTTGVFNIYWYNAARF